MPERQGGFVYPRMSEPYRRTAEGNAGHFYDWPGWLYFALRYSSIAVAAVLPAPMAKITVAAPVTASPPA